MIRILDFFSVKRAVKGIHKTRKCKNPTMRYLKEGRFECHEERVNFEAALVLVCRVDKNRKRHAREKVEKNIITLKSSRRGKL